MFQNPKKSRVPLCRNLTYPWGCFGWARIRKSASRATTHFLRIKFQLGSIGSTREESCCFSRCNHELDTLSIHDAICLHSLGICERLLTSLFSQLPLLRLCHQKPSRMLRRGGSYTPYSATNINDKQAQFFLTPLLYVSVLMYIHLQH